VLGIVGIVVAMAANSYRSYVERARVVRAVVEIKNLATELQGILATRGSLPATLAAGGLGGPRDPWDNPYRYLPLLDEKLPGVGAGSSSGSAGGGGPGGGAGGSGASAGSGGGGPGGGGGGGGPAGQPRKDRFLVPINTDFDLYSMGRDGESVPALTAAKSRDDVVRAANGSYIGLASRF
jgi:general secretion pathway protein G